MLQIQLNTGDKTLTFKAPKGKQLKGLISDAGIQYTLNCGGAGRCGKCKVKFREGAPAPNNADRSFISKKELDEGIRLLCRCVLTEDAIIELGNDRNVLKAEDTMAAETMDFDELGADESDALNPDGKAAAGIAIDIGTTTIAMAVISVDENGNKKTDTISGINHQRDYGADVISRIQAASDVGTAQLLKEIIQKDILHLCQKLLYNNVKKADTIVITGNTTMLHLLRGLDVKGLGKYPYKTGSLELEKISGKELFSENSSDEMVSGLEDSEVYIMPGISAFVGADIVAGIYELGLHKGTTPALFMDLGTNGEMVYADESGLLVTSTAAGPVFEACGISCGVPSVKGAISHVTIKDADKETVEYETIGTKTPIGLCGTGVLETVSELVRTNTVDETGLLTDKYFEKGFVIADEGEKIAITQSDIRNVQLAKAAIYVGQQELVKDNTVKEIYVAGGFGTHIDPDKIKRIKLFYDEKAAVIPVGNTALKGAYKFMLMALAGGIKLQIAITDLQEIVDRAKEIALAGSSDFSANYMEAMHF